VQCSKYNNRTAVPSSHNTQQHQLPWAGHVKKSEDANKAAKKKFFFAHQNSKNSLAVECLPACRHIRRRELLPLVVFLVMDWKKKERGREDWRTLKSLFFSLLLLLS
jgi:hypothetical protein